MVAAAEGKLESKLLDAPPQPPKKSLPTPPTSSSGTAPPPPPPPPTGDIKIKAPSSVSQGSSEPSSGGVKKDLPKPSSQQMDLLAQIRAGTKLKKVEEIKVPELAKMNEKQTNDLANQIARVMELRRAAVEEGDDDDWSDDDDFEL